MCICKSAGWQPIETVPESGYFLVHEDGAIRTLFRVRGKWEPVAWPGLVNQFGDAVVGADANRMLPAGWRLEIRDGCCTEPTHWMPLPEPPESTDEQPEAH